jgi:hypothetical protein
MGTHGPTSPGVVRFFIKAAQTFHRPSPFDDHIGKLSVMPRREILLQLAMDWLNISTELPRHSTQAAQNCCATVRSDHRC